MSVSLIDGHIDDDVMTDEQIIKALECCIANDNKCPDCPIFGSEICGKPALFFKEVFDHINRQKAEIEMWKSSTELWEGDAKALFTSRESLKAEAVKEFAERLKEKEFASGVFGSSYCREKIDNLVKEMVGE